VDPHSARRLDRDPARRRPILDDLDSSEVRFWALRSWPLVEEICRKADCLCEAAQREPGPVVERENLTSEVLRVAWPAVAAQSGDFSMQGLDLVVDVFHVVASVVLGRACQAVECCIKTGTNDWLHISCLKSSKVSSTVWR